MGTSARQQEVFDEFRNEHNEERPHEALDQKPPAIREIKDGIWNVYFGPLVLGYVDLTEGKKNRHGYERLKV